MYAYVKVLLLTKHSESILSKLKNNKKGLKKLHCFILVRNFFPIVFFQFVKSEPIKVQNKL